jgi:hypothetical protein
VLQATFLDCQFFLIFSLSLMIAFALAPHQNRAYLSKSLARHLMVAGGMCDYLDRFEGELSVVV